MEPRLYERLSTTCLFLAVGSALLFGHAGNLKILTGLVGVCAGLTAVVIYFKNQAGRSDTKSEFDPVSKSVSAPTSQAVQLSNSLGENSGYVNANVREVDIGECTYTYGNLDHHLAGFYSGEIHQRAWVYFDAMYARMAEPTPSDPVTARVVNIVQRLSTANNMGAFEFVLCPDGNFIIRPMTHLPLRAEIKAAAVDLEETPEPPTTSEPKTVH